MVRQHRNQEPVTATCKARSVADRLRNGSRRDRLPPVRAEIVRGLVENYGMPITYVARRVRISTSVASKVLTTGLSS